MASDTWGKVSATRFRNTVNESKMVTPATEHILNLAVYNEDDGFLVALAKGSFSPDTTYRVKLYNKVTVALRVERVGMGKALGNVIFLWTKLSSSLEQAWFF